MHARLGPWMTCYPPPPFEEDAEGHEGLVFRKSLLSGSWSASCMRSSGRLSSLGGVPSIVEVGACMEGGVWPACGLSGQGVTSFGAKRL